MTSQRRVVASLSIGIIGWFSPVLANLIPGALIVTALVGPVVTGVVGAALGRGRGLPWLLLGFLLPPAAVLIVAYASSNESSGFDITQYTMLGLVLVVLGFYAWLGAQRVWTSRRRPRIAFHRP